MPAFRRQESQMVRSIEVVQDGGPADSDGDRPPEKTVTDCGLVLGAILDSAPGRNLTHGDYLYIQDATLRSLETALSDQTSSWCNPDTGNSGSVTPFAAEAPSTGQNFRAFRQTVMARGLTQQAFGTACRQSDGTWKLTD
jgi:surface antigen